MFIVNLGFMGYETAWREQESAHAEVVAGQENRLLLVEHPAVVTLGRRTEPTRFLRTEPAELTRRGVELVQSDRGGDITFHGPGQIVAYPILRLLDYRLSVGGYVHTLERIVIDTLKQIGISSYTDPQAVGVWTRDGGEAAKICSIGVRIRKGVTMHGLALNVTTDMSGFGLIVPCGLEGASVTSVAQVLGDAAPTIDAVREILTDNFVDHFSKNDAPIADNPSDK